MVGQRILLRWWCVVPLRVDNQFVSGDTHQQLVWKSYRSSDSSSSSSNSPSSHSSSSDIPLVTNRILHPARSTAKRRLQARATPARIGADASESLTDRAAGGSTNVMSVMNDEPGRDVAAGVIGSEDPKTTLSSGHLTAAALQLDSPKGLTVSWVISSSSPPMQKIDHRITLEPSSLTGGDGLTTLRVDSELVEMVRDAGMPSRSQATLAGILLAGLSGLTVFSILWKHRRFPPRRIWHDGFRVQSEVLRTVQAMGCAATHLTGILRADWVHTCVYTCPHRGMFGMSMPFAQPQQCLHRIASLPSGIQRTSLRSPCG